MAEKNVAKESEPDSKRMQMIATAFIIICLVFFIWIFVRQYAAGLGTGLVGGGAPQAPSAGNNNSKPGNVSAGGGELQVPSGNGGNASNGSAGGQTLSPLEACLQNLGITRGAVVFIHTNTCPHCTTMKPIVEKLVGEGYDFVYAEYYDPAAAPVRDCLAQYRSGYVPQFICAYTGDEITGEASEQELRNFAEACRS
ncbi:MAG: hypothetical protein NT157_07035 [Candidatus Micrarchaeota archaeon]|nr:hypothetical protein [Candidatus Micrarchaeota archaeon]